MYVKKSLVVEVEALELIEDLITCSICKDILNSPIQCSICENVFCGVCFEEYISNANECPFKCKNPINKPCRIAHSLLDNFTFKCINECGAKIKYSNLEDHYHKTCPNKNYHALIKSVLAQINNLQQQNAHMKNLQVLKTTTPFHCSSINHVHPLVYLSTNRESWLCDVCAKHFPGTTKSFYCTLCDYDLCSQCYNREKFYQ